MSEHDNETEDQRREREERERAAHTPQGDHTPRQEEQYARDRQQQGAPQGQQQQQPPTESDEDRERRAAASIGAQVILDYNSPASLGARGGAGETIEENTQARDAHLVELGLDPAAPSGPPPVGGAAKKREVEPEPPPEVTAQATRMSSLAAGTGSPLERPGAAKEA